MAYDRARPSKKAGFAQLERVLLQQPWHTTASFRDAVETETPLNLTGPSDPSQRGLMFDLTKMPPRTVEGSALQQTQQANKGKRGKRKRRLKSNLGVTVSGSDLRRLTADESASVLAAFGVAPAALPSNRFARIELIASHSAALLAASPQLKAAAGNTLLLLIILIIPNEYFNPNTCTFHSDSHLNSSFES